MAGQVVPVAMLVMRVSVVTVVTGISLYGPAVTAARVVAGVFRVPVGPVGPLV